MSVRMYPWFGVPPGLIKSGLYLKLSPSDKDLCLYLYWKSDRCSSRQFEARDREIITYMGLSLRSLCNARKKLSKLRIARCERTLGGLYTYTLCDLSTGQPYLGDPKHPIVRPKKDVQKQAVMSPTPINWFEEERLDETAVQVPEAPSHPKFSGSRTSTGDKAQSSPRRATPADEIDTSFNFGCNEAKKEPEPTIEDYSPFKSGPGRFGTR